MQPRYESQCPRHLVATRRKLQTPGNAEVHKRQDHLQPSQSAQPTNPTDQAQSTTERTAWENPRLDTTTHEAHSTSLRDPPEHEDLQDQSGRKNTRLATMTEDCSPAEMGALGVVKPLVLGSNLQDRLRS